jgi:hypothetical protein
MLCGCWIASRGSEFADTQFIVDAKAEITCKVESKEFSLE